MFLDPKLFELVGALEADWAVIRTEYLAEAGFLREGD